MHYLIFKAPIFLKENYPISNFAFTRAICLEVSFHEIKKKIIKNLVFLPQVIKRQFCEQGTLRTSLWGLKDKEKKCSGWLGSDQTVAPGKAMFQEAYKKMNWGQHFLSYCCSNEESSLFCSVQGVFCLTSFREDAQISEKQWHLV